MNEATVTPATYRAVIDRFERSVDELQAQINSVRQAKAGPDKLRDANALLLAAADLDRWPGPVGQPLTTTAMANIGRLLGSVRTLVNALETLPSNLNGIAANMTRAGHLDPAIPVVRRADLRSTVKVFLPETFKGAGAAVACRLGDIPDDHPARRWIPSSCGLADVPGVGSVIVLGSDGSPEAAFQISDIVLMTRSYSNSWDSWTRQQKMLADTKAAEEEFRRRSDPDFRFAELEKKMSEQAAALAELREQQAAAPVTIAVANEEPIQVDSAVDTAVLAREQ